MPTVVAKTPAKINLTLEVLGKRQDGFHEIRSIMQAINLYDYLTVSINDNDKTEILLSGNTSDIPYDEKNLVHKAASEFIAASGIKNKLISIYIEKNIPISAGLAGGSGNAAGCFLALNTLCQKPCSEQEMNVLCSKLGSDLNFCLIGGCALCTSRGEVITPVKFCEFDVSLIKPKNLGISAKEAYTKFSLLADKSTPNSTEQMLHSMEEQDIVDEKLLYNSLQKAVINDYEALQFIRNNEPNSLMSGSGTTFFALRNKPVYRFDANEFWVKEGLNSIPTGVEIVS